MNKLKAMEVIVNGEKQLRLVDYVHEETLYSGEKVPLFEHPVLNEGELVIRTIDGSCYVLQGRWNDS